MLLLSDHFLRHRETVAFEDADLIEETADAGHAYRPISDLNAVVEINLLKDTAVVDLDELRLLKQMKILPEPRFIILNDAVDQRSA